MKRISIVLISLVLFYSSLLIAGESSGKVTNLNMELIEAVKKSDLPAVKKLIRKGADVNSTDKTVKEEGDFVQPTALTIALLRNDTRMARYLLSRKGKWRYDTLHNCAMKGYINGVKLLVKAGADYNRCDLGGDLPVTYAADNGHVEIVKYLLSLKSSTGMNSPEQLMLKAKNNALQKYGIVYSVKGKFTGGERLFENEFILHFKSGRKKINFITDNFKGDLGNYVFFTEKDGGFLFNKRLRSNNFTVTYGEKKAVDENTGIEKKVKRIINVELTR